VPQAINGVWGIKMENKRVLKELPKLLRDISFRPMRSIEEQGLDSDYDLKSGMLKEGNQLIQALSVSDVGRYFSQMGKYYSNNGMIAYADGMGDIFSIPDSNFDLHNSGRGMVLELQDRIREMYGRDNICRMLEDAGYKHSAIFVPHSNDCGNWAHMIFNDARVIDRIERQFNMEKYYKRLGNEPKLDLPQDIADRFKPSWEGFDDLGANIQCIGLFNSNNGVISYVDKYAIPHVAPAEEDLSEKLKDAGFKEGNIWVPHSNDCGVWIRYMFPREEHRILEESIRENNRHRLEYLREQAGIVVQE
jgi:hypothetical protein